MPNKTKIFTSIFSVNKRQKRFILHLRYVDNHLFRDKIKFEDWNNFQNYLEGYKSSLFKFDLKSGYHHANIFDG